MAPLAQLVALHRESPVEGVDEYVAEGLRLLREFPDPVVESRLRSDWSWILSTRGDTSEAIEQAESARLLAVGAGHDANTAFADYHIAVARWYGAEVESALAAAERARTVQSKQGDRGALATTLTLMGAIQRSRGEASAALEFHLEALHIAEALGDPSMIARSQNNIGLIYWNFDEPETARDWFLPALATYRELGSRAKIATALSNLGLIHNELDDPDGALVYLEEGLELYRELDRERGRATLLSNLAFAYEKLEDDTTALDYHSQALELRERHQDRRPMARTLCNMGGIYRRAGRLDEALDLYFRGLSYAEEADAKREQATLHAGIAEVYSDLGQAEKALESYERHRRIVRDLNPVETARRLAKLEVRKELAGKQRELEALDRRRIEQQLELSEEKNRRAILMFGALLLGCIAMGLFLLSRARTRSLTAVRKSHRELERTTTKLREMERRYRSVFEDGIVPKLIVDLDASRLVEANEPAARLAGANFDVSAAVNIDTMNPRWLARALADIGPGLDSDERRLEEWTDPTGSVRHAEIWATPLALTGRRCAVVTIHDVTESRKLEEERIRRDKLESVGQLAGGIAHDFNNALTAIYGYVSASRAAKASAARSEALREGAEAAITQSRHLTSQLLAFAKGGEPQREWVDVYELLRDAVGFAVSGSSVQVEFEIASDLWAAELDAGQFKQVVTS